MIAADWTYGYLRITEELKKIGCKYNQKTVYKLMKELNIASVIRAKKRYKQGKISYRNKNQWRKALFISNNGLIQ